MTDSRDTQSPGAGNYASVNGLNMYYEIHGVGQPLVLLHGAFSAIGISFGNVLPELATTRQVITFEMQAHGHTADIDRPLSMEQMTLPPHSNSWRSKTPTSSATAWEPVSPCRSLFGIRR